MKMPVLRININPLKIIYPASNLIIPVFARVIQQVYSWAGADDAEYFPKEFTED